MTYAVKRPAPWEAVYQQTQRWVRAGCFEAIAHDAGIRRTYCKGFVLLLRRWTAERSFAWAARFRRLARNYERWPQTLADFHFLACACLMLPKIVDLTHAGSYRFTTRSSEE
ncbi:Transposase DDE domain-containing protein [Burkholderia sp. b14]|nr:Transposase DDE domain-containing protein [Burkholderia sp. b14]